MKKMIAVLLFGLISTMALADEIVVVGKLPNIVSLQSATNLNVVFSSTANIFSSLSNANVKDKQTLVKMLTTADSVTGFFSFRALVPAEGKYADQSKAAQAARQDDEMRAYKQIFLFAQKANGTESEKTEQILKFTSDLMASFVSSHPLAEPITVTAPKTPVLSGPNIPTKTLPSQVGTTQTTTGDEIVVVAPKYEKVRKKASRMPQASFSSFQPNCR